MGVSATTATLDPPKLKKIIHCILTITVCNTYKTVHKIACREDLILK